MKHFQFISIIAFALFISACSTPMIDIVPPAPMPEASDNQVPVGDQGGHQKVGNPYRIAGKWYYPKDEPNYDEVGLASWYGPQFHGKLTANGETFNMNALTAAHKTLALPSFAKVTNLDNGRSIIVRINDRGPYVGTRIIDVSRRAAQMLGFADKGVTRVRVQAVDQYGRLNKKSSRANKRREEDDDEGDDDEEEDEEYDDDSDDKQTMEIQSGDITHYVQLGAYGDPVNAERIFNKADALDLNPKSQKIIIGGRPVYRIRLGPYRTREIADRVMRKIVDYGFFEAKVLSERVN